jgi:microcystin-dependent protein
MASQPYLGGIFMFAGNFAPRGYALCQGQLLSIAQNTALFSILGTTYGGDGIQTFALPDLRGRGPIGAGNGPGLSPTVLGEKAGSQNATLLISNMPTHSHTLNGSTSAGTQPLPTGNALASVQDSQGGQSTAYINAAANTPMAPTSIGAAGNSLPFSIQNPYLTINFIIATQGIFPSRN